MSNNQREFRRDRQGGFTLRELVGIIAMGDQNLNGPFQAEFRLLAAVQKKAKQ